MTLRRYFSRVLAAGLLLASSIAYADAVPPATTTPADIAAPAEMKLPAHHEPVITPGRRIGGDEPKYPGLAKLARIQGIVIVSAKITKEGHLADLKIVSSPHQMLSDAALKAVRTWTYEPYLMDGKPTEVDTQITVNFSNGKKKD